MSSSLCGRLHGIFTNIPKPKPTPTSTATKPKISQSTTFSATQPDISQSTITGSESTTTSRARKLASIIKNFKRNSRSVKFRRDQNKYEAIVRRLASGKHYAAIESVLDYQKKFKDSITDEGFAVRLISLYGKAKMFDHARKLFDELPSLECPRTVMSFNALLSACINSKKYDKISEVFTEIPDSLSIEPDTVSYNTVIKAFCEMDSMDSAITVMDEMEKNGVKPDLVTYNTVLDAYYKSNKLSDAEKLWDLMKEKNLVANVRSYNAKLRGLVRNKRVLEGVELIKEMEKSEVKPDTFSYNAVIKGCVNDDNLEEAKRLCKKMTENSCVPDHVTFAMLIQFASDKGDFDYAIDLCKKAIELKQHLYDSVMQNLVDGLVKRSRVEEAKELVESFNSSANTRSKLKMLVTE